MTRRSWTAVAAGVMLVAAGVVPAPPAQGATTSTPKCVTVKEYKKIRTGQTRKKVRALLGPKGRIVWELKPYGQIRSYKPCKRYTDDSWVLITFGRAGTVIRAEAYLILDPPGPRA